jgi:hypothetical protein
MDSTQIERYLDCLGQKLDEMQTKATLILLGGALMVTQIGNRKSTQDIDVVIATSDRRTYQIVQQAINLVAKEKKLSSSGLMTTSPLLSIKLESPKHQSIGKPFQA